MRSIDIIEEEIEEIKAHLIALESVREGMERDIEKARRSIKHLRFNLRYNKDDIAYDEKMLRVLNEELGDILDKDLTL